MYCSFGKYDWSCSTEEEGETKSQEKNWRKFLLLKRMTPLWTERVGSLEWNENWVANFLVSYCLLFPLLSILQWSHTCRVGIKEAQLHPPDTNLSVSVSMAAFPLLLNSKPFDWRTKGDSGFDWAIQSWAGKGDSSRMPSSVLHHHPYFPPPPPPQVGRGVRNCDCCGRTRWDSGSLRWADEARLTPPDVTRKLWVNK